MNDTINDEASKIMGILSLVFGFIAIATCWIPMCKIFVFIFGIAGVVLGAVTISRISKNSSEMRLKNMAIAGLVLCSIAIVLSIILPTVLGLCGIQLQGLQGGMGPQGNQQMSGQGLQQGGPQGNQGQLNGQNNSQQGGTQGQMNGPQGGQAQMSGQGNPGQINGQDGPQYGGFQNNPGQMNGQGGPQMNGSQNFHDGQSSPQQGQMNNKVDGQGSTTTIAPGSTTTTTSPAMTNGISTTTSITH